MRNEEKSKLAALYELQPLPVDRLPYTPEFDAMVSAYNETRPEGGKLSHQRVWEALVGMRKAMKLSKKG